MLIIQKFAHELFQNITDKNYSLKDYAASLKNLFNLEEYSLGVNKLGAFLYHIQVYLNNDERTKVDDDFKLDWSYDFSQEQLDTMSWCYKAESYKSLSSISLKKIISKICFVEQFVARP